ncbi:MAG TPA: hypothetical protein VKV38_10360 [Trebonia sp.]|jgi:hypothetical protein|nr:hypothetical protein [Trebonia sp.]
MTRETPAGGADGAMAALAYFRKVAELDATVTYRVGKSPDELTADLVLDKATRKPVVPEGSQADPLALTAAGKIVRLREEQGAWPENGVKAS